MLRRLRIFFNVEFISRDRQLQGFNSGNFHGLEINTPAILRLSEQTRVKIGPQPGEVAAEGAPRCAKRLKDPLMH